MFKKIVWYTSKLLNFGWAAACLLVHLISHPRELRGFLFTVFSMINEHHQMAYGRLSNFEETKFFKQLSNRFIFARSNLFNRDDKVTRSMETHFLATVVEGLAPRTIFEIGTYNGFTTLHMAVNSPEDCKIYTLDLPPDYIADTSPHTSYDDLQVIQLSHNTKSRRFYKGLVLEHKIEELYGDSAKFDFSPYYGKMDVVFIDGNHSLAYVASDTENAFKMLSSRGVIVWHDFDYIIHKDIFTYLNQLSKKYRIYSVPHTRFAIYGKDLS